MEKTEIDDKALKEFMTTFIFLQRFNCFEAIDAMFLKMINEDWSQESIQTNKILIVTFCRTNAMFRNKIKNYDTFVEKAKNYLTKNNIDPMTVIKGII